MAYTIISQNNTTTTLQDENGNIIYVPGHVTLATSTDYTITGVNNNTATLTDGSGKVIRDVPCVVVLAGGGSSDTHNKGYFATQAALEEAYPTAEAGDYAIVGSTDTVWVWDEDGSAWVDSDTKGEVTSVNGQTGAVTLTIPDAVQYSVMPTAGADNEGDIVQFTGTTDANYTNGYFYKCVSDGQTPATYSWTRVDVQPAPEALPSQTGQSGKFLTTDGTDASWGTQTQSDWNQTNSSAVDYIKNKPAVSTSSGTVLVGSSASGSGISLGYAKSGTCGISIGDGSEASNYSIAIGYQAKVGNLAAGAIAIGACNGLTITEPDTFNIVKGNNIYKMMDANGTIPTARLTKVNTTVTLAAADWSSNTQTVSVTGVTATGIVFVSPDPTDQSAYTSAGIICSAQAAGTLTFTCSTTPSADLSVNVVML